MVREQIEALVDRKLTDAEWRVACELLEFIERHPDAELALERCIERGLSVDQTIEELTKLPPA